MHTGQALVDVVVEVPSLPRRGQNVMAGSSTRYAGGSVSVLVAAALAVRVRDRRARHRVRFGWCRHPRRFRDQRRSGDRSRGWGAIHPSGDDR